MSDQHDDWVEIGQTPRRAPNAPGVAPSAAQAPPEEEKTYGKREPTPPWKVCQRVAAISFIVMAFAYIFPDVRYFETPWDRSFPITYIAFILPAFALLWGIIGIVNLRFAKDRRRALVGIVIALASIGIGVAELVTHQKPDTAGPASSDRVQLTPQQMNEWREKKLHR